MSATINVNANAGDLLSEDYVRKYVLPVFRDVFRRAGVSESRTWSFVIPGEPVAKGRPKLGTVNGHAMAFTPKKTRAYEDIVRQTAVREWNRPILQSVPISLRAWFYRGIGASWSKKKQASALSGELCPISRPDLDNMVKAITDGMNGVVYVDDSLIVDTHSSKHYALQPRVVVSIAWGNTTQPQGPLT